MSWKRIAGKVPPFGLLYGGVLLLAIGWALDWLNHNWYLFLCLALVLAGVVLHVWRLKRESRY